ncbi:MAG: type VI secretion protein [Shewanella sp.]|nr:type VI secretion protein [Shewanella sp.]MCF1430125.1 type VI secretion protein [Shewanella sp.]MCF1438428.1 type VI secretion protein [Shewanella sp.]MCF1458809.1 type VI secretion protein [Shewanella sp.]
MHFAGISAVCLLLSTQAVASVESQLTQCAAINDKLDRLICYDKLAATVTQHLPQAAMTATSPSVSVAQSESTAAPVTIVAPKEQFGLENKARQQVQEIDKLYFDVTDVDKDAYGNLKLTFTNGQQWKQTESRRFKVKAGQTVYIERAALGSFLLGMDDRNSTIRVKRIK